MPSPVVPPARKQPQPSVDALFRGFDGFMDRAEEFLDQASDRMDEIFDGADRQRGFSKPFFRRKKKTPPHTVRITLKPRQLERLILGETINYTITGTQIDITFVGK